MSKILINGRNKLYGKIKIEQAKNAFLPIMCASILASEKVCLKSPPDISDIFYLSEILKDLGVNIEKNDKKIEIFCENLKKTCIDPSLASKLRSSIFLLGAIISKSKIAKIPRPGGCDIGTRPIDLHIKGLKILGVKIIEKHGYIYCDARNIHSGIVLLDFASVGATENLIMASVFLEGKTILLNVAKEPEVVDLANFLNSLGAKISGAGTDKIEVIGVEKLHGGTYCPIPDRIVAGTYMIACSMCGGEIEIENFKSEDNIFLVSKLREAGVKIFEYENSAIVCSTQRLISLKKLETAPYPQLSTDLQSLFLSMQSISNGSCMIIENIFENRFKVAMELCKMDADISIYKNVAIVNGKPKLYGAEVYGTDLRATASLILAGLVAEGYTTVHGIEFLSRGYENMVEKLRTLGADIKLIE